MTDAKGTSHADRHLDHGGNDHHLFTNGSGASLLAGKATTAKRYRKNLRMSMPLRVHAERLRRRFSTTCKELARTRWFPKSIPVYVSIYEDVRSGKLRSQARLWFSTEDGEGAVRCYFAEAARTDGASEAGDESTGLVLIGSSTPASAGVDFRPGRKKSTIVWPK